VLAHAFVGFGVATGAAQSISGDYRELEPKRTPASPPVDGGLPLGDFPRVRRLLKVDDLILDEASWPAYENGSCRADGFMTLRWGAPGWDANLMAPS
jgi:hypothetical protein